MLGIQAWNIMQTIEKVAQLRSHNWHADFLMLSTNSIQDFKMNNHNISPTPGEDISIIETRAFEATNTTEFVFLLA